MKYIKLEILNSIAVIKISNPKQLNALNENVLKDLDYALKKVENQNKVKVIVITGDGDKAFVAGADIKLMSKMSKEEAYNFSQKGQK